MDAIWAEGNGVRVLVESYALKPAPPHPPGSPSWGSVVWGWLGAGMPCAPSSHMC